MIKKSTTESCIVLLCCLSFSFVMNIVIHNFRLFSQLDRKLAYSTTMMEWIKKQKFFSSCIQVKAHAWEYFSNVLFRERNSLALFSSLDQYQGENSFLIVQYHLNDDGWEQGKQNHKPTTTTPAKCLSTIDTYVTDANKDQFQLENEEQLPTRHARDKKLFRKKETEKKKSDLCEKLLRGNEKIFVWNTIKSFIQKKKAFLPFVHSLDFVFLLKICRVNRGWTP